MDFPSRLTRELNRSDISPEVSVLTYSIDEDDVESIETVIGPNTVTDREAVYTTYYNGNIDVQLHIDETNVIRYLVKDLELPESTKARIKNISTAKELATLLTDSDTTSDAIKKIVSTINSWKDSSPTCKAIELLTDRRPRFVYYEDYDIMPGKISVPDLIARRKSNKLSRGEEALLALLDMAGVKMNDLLTVTDSEKTEEQIRKLENAANSISDEVFEYWSQNTELSVELRLIPGPEQSNGRKLEDTGPFLQIRIKNARHRVTVPFNERSRGFVWFFHSWHTSRKLRVMQQLP